MALCSKKTTQNKKKIKENKRSSLTLIYFFAERGRKTFFKLFHYIYNTVIFFLLDILEVYYNQNVKTILKWTPV